MAESSAKAILADLLQKYATPSFGHLPKREIDLLVLDAMVRSGQLSDNPDIAELISKLRITRAKARSLLYDRDLRRLDTKQLDLMLKAVLQKPLIQKQGDTFVLEIENPYLQDHLKSVLREQGHVTDRSFGSGLVRLSAAGLSILLVRAIDDKNVVKRELIAAGAQPDKSLKAVLVGALSVLGKKVASEAGEEIAEDVGDLFGALMSGAADRIQSLWGRVLKQGGTA